MVSVANVNANPDQPVFDVINVMLAITALMQMVVRRVTAPKLEASLHYLTNAMTKMVSAIVRHTQKAYSVIVVNLDILTSRRPTLMVALFVPVTRRELLVYRVNVKCNRAIVHANVMSLVKTATSVRRELTT